jgi:hypothetical protein
MPFMGRKLCVAVLTLGVQSEFDVQITLNPLKAESGHLKG